jgi:methylenetetrahydrofolate reductase (NADPH)
MRTDHSYLHIPSLKDLFQQPPARVSFEFFPPKSPAMEDKLWTAVKLLSPLSPAFVSVTYGAGGSTRERTHATLQRIINETELTPAAHLTCVGASRASIDEVARQYWEMGVRHIVALRGDAPPDVDSYTPHPEGYAYAVDLVTGLKKLADFDISVACYPECHPEAQSLEADIDNLKRKVGAGASRAITQFFFEPEIFLRFRDKAVAAGIDCSIVPGILPVTNFEQLTKFAAMCGAGVPNWLAYLFEDLDDHPEFRHLIAASVAAEQCRILRANGVEEFHFYTLNRARLTRAICHILGIRAEQKNYDGPESL